MMVRCFDCKNFSMREKDGKVLEVAKVGLGKCPTRIGSGGYVSGNYPRECGKFEPSEEGQGGKRRRWVESHYHKIWKEK